MDAMKVVSAAEMRNIDRRATSELGIPSLILMENAAIAVAEAIADRYPQARQAAIFCGPGANGGDGLAVARHLDSRGIVPRIILIGERSRYRGDAATNLSICERLALGIVPLTGESEVHAALAEVSRCEVIVDAIFGTGLNRAPEGIYAAVIAGIGELGIPIVSIDLPSGLDASSAEPFEPHLIADLTICLALPKICHILDPAAACCGELAIADISIPPQAVDREDVQLSVADPEDVARLVAPRAADTHKGSYGHVVIVGGSPGRSGAAILAARGAVRGGAGLVTVATDRDTGAIVSSRSVESMTRFLSRSTGEVEELARFISHRDAALVGPGLPDDEESYAFARALIDAVEVPLVIDASGLNAFQGRPAEINRGSRERVITPHPGELGRLLERTAAEINKDRLASAREAARVCNCVVVLKGHRTLVAEPGGEVSVNSTGNAGMASGGMGDVLGGLIAALLGQGKGPFDAAKTGVYLHGLAADLLMSDAADIGLSALDVANAIPRAIATLRDRAGSWTP
jgi:hydroxyethylthiazole kinase-like uncharacterized protein yjeF